MNVNAATVAAERAALADRDPHGERDAIAPLLSRTDRAKAFPLSSISTDPPPPMLVGRLDPEGHTILYGPGGVGKGALTCWWIVQLTRAGERVMVLDYEGHPAEWARRIGSLDPSVVPDVWYLEPAKPLRAIASEVRKEAVYREITYIVVDSAVMACGDDPMKPETARAYGEGLLTLGVPVLTLAHVTKLDDGKYPFGSVFWHNLARTTWSLAPDGDTTLLVHRKGNNYAKVARQSVAMTWTDGKLREVWERSQVATLGDEIAEILDGKPAGLTLAEIVTEISGADRVVARSSVHTALTRGIGPMGRFTCVQVGSATRWKLSA